MINLTIFLPQEREVPQNVVAIFSSKNIKAFDTGSHVFYTFLMRMFLVFGVVRDYFLTNIIRVPT